MSAVLETKSVEFRSHGTRCAAWLTRPAGQGAHPGVVLVHGLGGTHEMMLAQYEQRFAAAGIATLAFDYRHLAASDGQPRQRIAMHRQRQDVFCALEFLRKQPGIDARRIGLWGTSLGSMHVVHVAAARPEVAAAIVQCPILHGPGAARGAGIRATMRMTPAITADVTRFLLRLPRCYIPIVGEPGTAAIVTAPGAVAGWESMFPPGHPADVFHNRIAASNAMGIVGTSAMRRARQLSAPLLVCICDRETLTSQHYAELVAGRAARGETFRIDAGHFDVYHPPFVETLLARQTAFLKEHLLGVRRVRA
jgi:pimeloyl-ACP methyl ester carboxylesterase